MKLQLLDLYSANPIEIDDLKELPELPTEKKEQDEDVLDYAELRKEYNELRMKERKQRTKNFAAEIAKRKRQQKAA